ncbi:MAG: hypothetical protein LBF22_08185 [Deltaproteobacteria bacterium]|jgi:3-dehydroquinate synthetase|nr:hypothetical protein [Deltaproteobacteria bacterium]
MSFFFRRHKKTRPEPKNSPPQEPQKNFSPQKHVVLIGFMGAGKTSVGEILAELLGRPFVDLDDVLEDEFKSTIPQVFQTLGEEAFRQKEKEVLYNLINFSNSPKVIALGGGAILNPHSRTLLKEKTHTFYLSVDAPLTLWERITSQATPISSRPLAQDRNKFLKLYHDRLPLYEETGIPVRAEEPPNEVARIIAAKIFQKKPAILEVTTHKTQVLHTFFRTIDVLKALPELVGNRRALLLLDHALNHEIAPFQEVLGSNGHIFQTLGRGEGVKTLLELNLIFEALSKNTFDRSDWLIVRGGGSLSDLGGLAAGLYKRGIKTLFLPTTLLAAVDASIGGKAALNFQGAKNQVGLFHLPEEVWLDGEVLFELPEFLISEGLVEAFKTGLIADTALLNLIVEGIEALLPRGPLGPQIQHTERSLLLEIAYRSAVAKMQIVAQDFREEKGLREILNLGHTFGHVVESFYASSSDPVSHGRAVALGLSVALKFSEKHLQFPRDKSLLYQRLCLRLASDEFPPLPPEVETLRLLTQDKKIREGLLKFVGLKKPGEPVVLQSSPVEIASLAQEVEMSINSGELTPYQRD